MDPSQARPAAAADAGLLPEHRIRPFVDAVRTTLLETAGFEVTTRCISAAGGVPTAADVVAVVELIATPPLTLTLCFPRRTAEGLAAQILADTKVLADDAVIKDCIREIANVVAGQAKTALASTPYRFSYSIPTIPEGAASGRSAIGTTAALVATFDSPRGAFSMLLGPANAS